MPVIEKFMTTLPHTISKDAPLKDALSIMREHHIRHLPVEVDGALIGVLTDRDIKLASSFNHDGQFRVEEVMTPSPYTVAPGTPVDEVVVNMAEHKYGCAIVRQGNGKIVGIFTATDGLRVLGEVLKGNFKPVHNG